MSRIPSSMRRRDISKARLLAARPPFLGLGWRGRWLEGHWGQDQERVPGPSQWLSQLPRQERGSQWGGPSSKEGKFWLPQHLSGAVQEPGRGEGRMGCPKGSPEKHTWSAPLPHGAELSATLLPGLLPQPTPRSPSMIHWSLVDTGVLPTVGQCSALNTYPHPQPLSQHSTSG